MVKGVCAWLLAGALLTSAVPAAVSLPRVLPKLIDSAAFWNRP